MRIEDSLRLPRMLKIKEAAEETGLSYHFIRKLCLTGALPHVKVGNRYFINADSLAAFLKSGDAC